MTEITIPKNVYDRQFNALKECYAEEFGADALSSAQRSFSRRATILRYAKMIDFWNRHTPHVKPGLSIDDVARHAICTNALEQARKSVDDYGISSEVERELRDS